MWQELYDEIRLSTTHIPNGYISGERYDDLFIQTMTKPFDFLGYKTDENYESDIHKPIWNTVPEKYAENATNLAKLFESRGIPRPMLITHIFGLVSFVWGHIKLKQCIGNDENHIGWMHINRNNSFQSFDMNEICEKVENLLKNT